MRGACQLCDKGTLFDSCSIGVFEVKGDGDLVQLPYQLSIPLCCYHMVLAQEGQIGILHPTNEIAQSKIYTQLHDKSDRELKGFLTKIKRMPKNIINKSMKQCADSIISARKFQEQMEKAEKEDKPNDKT